MAYLVRLTAKFSDAKKAGVYERRIKAFDPERTSAEVVTCIVHGHGHEAEVRERAEQLDGEVKVEVLRDTE